MRKPCFDGFPAHQKPQTGNFAGLGVEPLFADDCAYLPVQAEKGGIHGLDCLLLGSLDELYHFGESGFGLGR